MNYKNKTLLLICIATAVRCIIASFTQLGNDEVYYRMYAQYLQWNYFDHPPVTGWLIRFTTANLYFDNEFFIRLGAIISGAISTWFIFLSGRKLNDEKTGFLAALIYSCTLYGSVIAGTFILPDAPQMVCWSAGIYLLTGIARYNHINRTNKRKMLLFGLVTGIGMLCKIHTAFLWIGLLLYLLQHNRSWFKQPVLYIAGIITVLLFYPVIQWNIDNHFITYLYHSKRVSVADSGLHPGYFLSFAGGQLFYVNPVILVLMIISTVAALKNNLPVATSQKRMLLFCSLPLVIICTGISFFKNVLPHWTGPSCCGLSLLTACYLGKQKIQAGIRYKIMPKSLWAASIFQLLVVFTALFIINYIPGTIGKKQLPYFGEGDFTLDMYGWNDLKAQFSKIVVQDWKSGAMKKDAAIICNKWFPASHIDYYVAMPLQKDLVAIGDTNDIHQYAWINKERQVLKNADDAYCIVPSNYYLNVSHTFSAFFDTIKLSDTIVQNRNKKTCRYFYVWQLKNFRAVP